MDNLNHRFNAKSDMKLDVYSWSMTMYETVCRVRPWNEIDSPEEVQRAVMAGERPGVPDPVKRHVCHEFRMPLLLEFIRDGWVQDQGQRPDMQSIAKNVAMLMASIPSTAAGNNNSTTTTGTSISNGSISVTLVNK